MAVTKIAACVALSLALMGPASAASADKRSSPAKGTKTCRISQYQSPYLAAHGNPNAITYPRPWVNKNGSVEMGFAEDLYPGTKIYYLIAGHRYSGPAGYMVALDKFAVEALKKDPVIEYTFTRWPYRNEINGADIIEGFEAAYKDCVAFMSGREGFMSDKVKHQPTSLAAPASHGCGYTRYDGAIVSAGC